MIGQLTIKENGNNTADISNFGISNKSRRRLQTLGVWKEENEAPEGFNKLLAFNLDAIEENNYIQNVLRKNERFVEVKPQKQCVRSFFEAFTGDMSSKRIYGSGERSHKYITEFEPLVKQFGCLLVFLTIKNGQELSVRYFVSARYADCAEQYVEKIFSRLRIGQSLSGIFGWSANSVRAFDTDNTVVFDSKGYLASNLKKHEIEWLNREKQSAKLSFDEKLDSNAFLAETKDILESFDGKNEEEDLELRNALLRDELEQLEYIQYSNPESELLDEANYAIDFIYNLIYGYDELEAPVSKNKDFGGDIDELLSYEDGVIVFSGAREGVGANAAKAIAKRLDAYAELDFCVLTGGAVGVDEIATLSALKRGIDVFVLSPTINKSVRVPNKWKAVAKGSGAKIGLIEPLVWQKASIKKRFVERNDYLAALATIAFYYGDTGKTGTGSFVRACKKHGKPCLDLKHYL